MNKSYTSDLLRHLTQFVHVDTGHSKVILAVFALLHIVSDTTSWSLFF
jgi:hypothetical protein